MAFLFVIIFLEEKSYCALLYLAIDQSERNDPDHKDITVIENHLKVSEG